MLEHGSMSYDDVGLDQGRGKSLNLVTTTQNAFACPNVLQVTTKVEVALQHTTGFYKISFLSIGIASILA
jgi:hypothetical protein